jgi:uncharacterized protein (DUF4415 family)
MRGAAGGLATGEGWQTRIDEALRKVVKGR